MKKYKNENSPENVVKEVSENEASDCGKPEALNEKGSQDEKSKFEEGKEEPVSEVTAHVERDGDGLTAEAKEIIDLKDRLLRALADAENTRRRAARDVEDARKYAASGLVKDLLNVSDNLRRAVETVTQELRESDESVGNLVIGIEMVEKEFSTSFERHGIKKIEPLGESFDHKFHQAIYEKPGTDYSDGTIAEVLQAGYLMHERLLRPAMVAVAKKTTVEENASVDPKSVDPKSVDPKSVDPKTVDPKTVDPKTIDPKTVDPKTVDPKS